MATGVTHSFVSAKAQGGDATIASKDEWNDSHEPDLTTKGDMIVEGASAAARLPVGSNKTLLGAASGEALGVKYIARSGTSELADIGDSESAGSDETVPYGDHVHKHPSGLNSDLHHAQSHTVASHSDTTATGSELETLTDGSNADALHIHGYAVRKKAFQEFNNTTNLANVIDLKLTVGANEDWAFELLLWVDGPTGNDIKVAFTFPSGDLAWSALSHVFGAGDTESLTVPVRHTASDEVHNVGLLGVGTVTPVRIWGTIANGATPGDLQLRAAQAVAGAISYISINSWLRATKLA